MAIPARATTGSVRDVKHIVVCMQENRSFDHYFDLLNGVRGFGDPRPLRLAGGRSVWAQPSKQHVDGYVLPFHGDSKTTRSFKVDGAKELCAGLPASSRLAGLGALIRPLGPCA